MESVKNVQKSKIYCYDCKKEIKIKGNKIQNGVLLSYNDNGEEIKIFKCNECFEKDSNLRNFRKCEVYSRIVGYLRPVQQWNKGKKQEFKERREFVQEGA